MHATPIARVVAVDTLYSMALRRSAAWEGRSQRWLYTINHTAMTKTVTTVIAASRSGDSASASFQNELVMTP
jgi:hypothetical protein